MSQLAGASTSFCPRGTECAVFVEKLAAEFLFLWLKPRLMSQVLVALHCSYNGICFSGGKSQTFSGLPFYVARVSS